MKSKGFTLIELLVVIAIIGLLSSVVLASLNVARTRGKDSAVKAAMKQLHTQAQNYLDLPSNNFGVNITSCASASLFNNAQFTLILNNITANAASGATLTCATDASNGTKWAVSVSALANAGTTWCTDNSQGWFKIGAAQTSGVNQGTCQ